MKSIHWFQVSKGLKEQSDKWMEFINTIYPGFASRGIKIQLFTCRCHMTSQRYVLSLYFKWAILPGMNSMLCLFFQELSPLLNLVTTIKLKNENPTSPPLFWICLCHKFVSHKIIQSLGLHKAEIQEVNFNRIQSDLSNVTFQVKIEIGSHEKGCL